jgi:hypothetical protein
MDRCNLIKLLYSLSLLLHLIIFAGKAGAYQSRAPSGLNHDDWLPSLSENIGIGW